LASHLRLASARFQAPAWKSLAVQLASLEAGRIGQTVTMRDVPELCDEAYQQDMNEYLGID